MILFSSPLAPLRGEGSGVRGVPPRDPDRIAFARNQRKQANEFAQDVWQMIRGRKILGFKFRREHAIGPYTVDFVCLELKLIIEVDGRDHTTEPGQLYD